MAEKKITAAVVAREYERGVSAFRRTLSDPALRLDFTRQADAFFRRCALGIWGAGGMKASEELVAVYNAIRSRQNPTPPADTLYFELVSSLSAPPAFQPPACFAAMAERDAPAARRFVNLCSLLLLLLAGVDDEVTPEEAACVTDYVDSLSRLCGGPRPTLNPADLVTGPAKAAPAGAGQTLETSEASEEAAPPPPDVDELLAELDGLCGLEQVKQDVRSLINLVKVRRLREEHGLPVPPMSLHLVFLGNPGTGKTTVARLLARLYHAIGVLSKGQLVEVDRSGLVAGYVGQTAIKTGEVLQSALGGVLFIDEAYALTSQEGANDFGREAVEVLLKGMEDHRKDLIVIVAGYSDLMKQFIHSNPGLESRFSKYFYFEDYTGEQLWAIFQSMCEKNGYVPDKELKEFAPGFFQTLYETRDENFGNAREVRNLFEQTVSCQSDRVSQLNAPTQEDLMALTLTDLKAAGEGRKRRSLK